MLSLEQFFKWNALGIWHSLVAYFSVWFLSSSSFISPKGLVNLLVFLAKFILLLLTISI